MVRYLIALVRWFAAILRSCPKRRAKGHAVNDVDKPFMVIGHRGSPTHEIENTMTSFQRAVEQEGANGLELDLCMTSDGVIVIWHDWDPDSTNALARESGLEPDVRYRPAPPDIGNTYRRRVSTLTLEELRREFGYIEIASGEPVTAHIPTFAEFLEWAGATEQLDIVFLDIKIPADEKECVPHFMELVSQLLESHNAGCRFVFETVHPEILDAMKQERPDYQYTLDVAAHPGIVLFPDECSCMDAAIQHGNSFATPQRPRSITLAPWITFRRIVEHDLKRCAQLQREHPDCCVEAVVGFTVNDSDEMGCLVRSGIHGIQSDKPALLRQTAEKLGRRITLPEESVV
jgi:glycerophosphoryl diester phosphodiesterase